MKWPLVLVAASVAAAAEGGLFEPKEISSYPFVASEQRVATISSRFTRISKGMTASEVKAELGEPDEIRPTYEPQVKNGKLVGHTYWYIIRRLAGSGSVEDKKEALVRVSFGLDGNVTKVDKWGI